MKYVAISAFNVPGAQRRTQAEFQIAAVLAVVFPTLLAFNVAPSATFLNQAAAFAGWGVLLVVLALRTHPLTASDYRTLLPMGLPMAVVAAATMYSMMSPGLPRSLSLGYLGTLLAAAAGGVGGAMASRSPSAQQVFRGFCQAMLFAGVLGALIGFVQVFMPELVDGGFIASIAVDGRAGANLRQPNHLSSLLVWAMVGLAWLWQAQAMRNWTATSIGLLLIAGIALTGSRTGIVDLLVLALWGGVGRSLPRPVRIALVLSPIAYGVLWAAFAEWAHAHHQMFAGEAKLSMQGDISSSRYAIWGNTLTLIGTHPWLGVGLGEFNFAWSLTPFPNRPTAFFDHTHNLVLQFAVELGIPLCTLLMGSLLYGLVDAWRKKALHPQPMASMLMSAVMFVVMIGIHSLLEYPLWYSYFLLPTAFAFGFCLAGRRLPMSEGPSGNEASKGWLFVAVGAAVVAGAVLSVWDYTRVSVIFTTDSTASLAQRIEAGRRSWLFAHQADYAAVTTVDRPSTAMESFSTTTHNLLDTRLMIAWAKAFAERGDLDRAKYLAMRLREFRNEDSKEFFAACEDSTVESKPFQCSAPSRMLSFMDFR